MICFSSKRILICHLNCNTTEELQLIQANEFTQRHLPAVICLFLIILGLRKNIVYYMNNLSHPNLLNQSVQDEVVLVIEDGDQAIMEAIPSPS